MGDRYKHEETPWRDQERLRDLYKHQGLTTYEIGERLGCSRKTIEKWVDRFDLKRVYEDGGLLVELRNENLSAAEGIMEDL